MNSRFLLTPPKHRLAQAFGSTTRPINSPSDVRQSTPSVPGPGYPTLDHRLPARSVHMPSANPGDISAKTSPPGSFHPSTTSKARMCPGPLGSCEFPVSEMYSRDSSGEKHSPFRFTRSPAATEASPAPGQRPVGSKEAVTSVRGRRSVEL